MKQYTTITDFLIFTLGVDFNEITCDFIRELPIEIQLETFFTNKNSETDHISQHFTPGQEINYNHENVEVLSIDNNTITVYSSFTNKNVKISATDALIQNGFLKEDGEYNFDTDIDFSSEKFIEIQSRILEEINSYKLLNINELQDMYDENGLEYVISYIEKYILKSLIEEISNEI